MTVYEFIESRGWKCNSIGRWYTDDMPGYANTLETPQVLDRLFNEDKDKFQKRECECICHNTKENHNCCEQMNQPQRDEVKIVDLSSDFRLWGYSLQQLRKIRDFAISHGWTDERG